MNQGHGVLIFGLCFFLFLAWLWRYPVDEQGVSSSSQESSQGGYEVEQWLSEQGLESLKTYMKMSGK